MNKTLMMMMARLYMAPAGDDGGAAGGGASVDRGDDFVPEPENEEEAAALAAQQAAAAAAAGKTEPTAEEAEAARVALGLGAGKPEVKEPKEGETEEEKEAKGAKKDTRIPLNRHTEILNRERAAREAAEAEVAKLKQGQQVVTLNAEITKLEDKVAGLETRYAEALAEGKTKEAADLMKEIRTSERSIIQQRAAFDTQVATAQAVEQVRYDTTVERLETAYPQLKPGSEDFDAEVVKEVLDLQEAFELKGLPASAALQKAVGYVIKPETKKQEDATKVTPRVTEDDAAAALAAKAARETEARKRNASAANAQPPAMGKVGANGDAAGGVLDAKAVIKMPFEKFVQLDDETLSRMRGDTV